MKRSGIGLGLVLSLLLHLAFFVAPGWQLLNLKRPSDPVRLDAKLIPVARRVMAPPSPAKAKPRAPERILAQPSPRPEFALAPPIAAAPESGPGVPPRAAPEAVPAEPPRPAPVVPAALPPPLPPPLPRHGRIRFAVSRGDQGFVIGQAIHRWSQDGKTYLLNSVTETTGIVALFRQARVEQTSEGEIGDAGLRPIQYRTERNGVAAEAASFEWQARILKFSGGREAPLLPGAQDVLSLFYQLGQQLPVVPREVMIATGKKFEPYDFVVLGEEKLPLSFGDQRVLHLKSVGEGGEATEIWLGMDLRGLPLKVRYTDRTGESFVQLAEQLEFDDNEPAAAVKPPDSGR